MAESAGELAMQIRSAVFFIDADLEALDFNNAMAKAIRIRDLADDLTAAIDREQIAQYDKEDRCPS